MNNPRVELLIEQLTMCQGETLRVAGTVPESSRYRQLANGKAHPAWLVGHLTSTIDSIVLNWILEQESALPKGFKRRFAPDFAGGLPVTPNPSDYPDWNEVLGLYQQTFEKVLGGIGHLQDSDLPGPLKGQVPDNLRNFFSSIGTSLNIMVIHDSHHRGQMGLLANLPG